MAKNKERIKEMERQQKQAIINGFASAGTPTSSKDAVISTTAKDPALLLTNTYKLRRDSLLPISPSMAKTLNKNPSMSALLSKQ